MTSAPALPDDLTAFARTGDSAAFERLVRQHVDLVYAAARRQTADPGMADDVTQTVFLLLAKKARRLSANAVLTGWLLQATRYCAADALRARRRRDRHEQGAAMLHQMTRPDAIDIDADLLQHLDAALAALGPVDRSAIALRYLQQQPFETVAATLGVSTDAAKKRVARALERLQQAFAGRGLAVSLPAVSAGLSDAATTVAPSNLAGVVIESTLAKLAGGGAGALGLLKLVGMIAACLLVAVVAAFLFLSDGGPKPSPAVAATRPATPGPGPTSRPLPAFASLDDTDRNIYDLIGTLRISVAPSRPEEWAAALRDLAAIGPAAVPALAAELDRTSVDKDQRLLLMALRYIGDPRAVPAVIRVIPRVAQRSSDYGTTMRDPELRKFIQARVWDGRPPDERFPDNIDFNRGITEAVATLEALTGHSEGREAIMDGPKFPGDRGGLLVGGPTTTQADLAAKQKQRMDREIVAHRDRQRVFAARWQAWWDKNADEFVTPEGQEQMAAAVFDGDLVGLALDARPPLFLVGPGVKLSREVAFFLPSQGLADVPCYLDFSNGGTNTYEADAFDIDGFINYGMPRGQETAYPTLDSFTVKAWQTDVRQYDTVVDDVKAGRPIKLPAHKRPDFRTVDPKTREFTYNDYPAVFFFETIDACRGIVRLDAPPAGIFGLNVRFVLWPGTPATQPTSPARVAADGLRRSLKDVTFGPATAITLWSPGSGQASAIRLSDNATFQLPKPTQERTDAERQAVLARRETFSVLADGKGDAFGLQARDAWAYRVSDAAWDDLTPAGLAPILASWQQRQQTTNDANDSAVIYDDRGNRYGAASATYVVLLGRDKKVALLRLTDKENARITFECKTIAWPGDFVQPKTK